MASIASKRLGKELVEIRNKGCTSGINLVQADDLKTWFFSLELLGDSIYKGETFLVKFTFPNRYPIESPEVVFVVDEEHSAPEHPHCYSNGHICLSILGNEWSPVLSAASVCISLQSMLASCQEKARPEDNDRYVRHAPKSPKQARFYYHDDTV